MLRLLLLFSDITDELKLKVTDLLPELNELPSGLCEGRKICK